MIEMLEEIIEYSSPENPWVRLYFDRVRFPNGKEGRYNRVVEGEIGQGVAVLPMTMNDSVGMIRIYRYPIGRLQWEIPRGFCTSIMTPQENAQRELEEETGIMSDDIVHLGTIFPNSGVLSTEVNVYLARHATARPTPIGAEQGAIMETRFFSPKEVKEMVVNGLIQDAITLSALALARVQGCWK